MVPAKKTTLYFILREWCNLGFMLYFKKIETKYIEPLPVDKPIIFVGNHNNTFIDPILIATNTRLYPAFLAMAAAFKKPVVAKFLHAIRMLPVYRQRDGVDSIKKNELIFDISIQQLEANLPFVIFAEGSHSSYRRLRSFKKGFARIGFEALKRNNGELDVQIVPVGVEYRQFTKMNQEVTQTFGKAIPLKDFWEEYQRDQDAALNNLKKAVYKSLQDILIHIPTEEYYEEVESLRNITRPWLYAFQGLKAPGLHEKMVAEKKMITAQTAMEKEQPEQMKSFAQKISNYQESLDKNNFRNHLIQKGPRSRFSMILQVLLMVILSPIYLLGVITSYIPYKLPVLISKKLFKDFMFHGAVNYAGALAFFTVFVLLETLLVQLVFGDWKITLVFLILMPFVGVFSFRFWIALKKLWHQWRYANFQSIRKQEAAELEQQYEDIIENTASMMNGFNGQ
jgi:1-acyl-sn-glycerol-3-phosphate acyltransferase